MYKEIFLRDFSNNPYIIIIAYGPTNSGKTFTILGN